MELEHSFTVPVPIEAAWDVLLDVEKVAPCMPGATIDSVEGDEIRGKIKVKVGPINMTYAGTARFVERDRAAGVVRLEASGKETRGAGTASATVLSKLEEAGTDTKIVVLTTLNVTGKPAQFGRGVMNEVGGRLLSIFAENLAATLAHPDGGAAAAAPAGAAPAGPDVPAVADAAPVAGGSLGTPLGGPLGELALTPRAAASLRKAGITTVGELAAKTGEELLAIEGIGQATVDDITAKLAELGVNLGEPAATLSVVATPTAVTAPAAVAPVPAAETAAEASAAHLTTPKHAAHRDEDAINLLRVAGMPVLKRALPIVAALAAAALIGLRRHFRHRRRSRP
jgi:carbon monoxide dehydrogenase subunit G